jgi:hypothetical protein
MEGIAVPLLLLITPSLAKSVKVIEKIYETRLRPLTQLPPGAGAVLMAGHRCCSS